MSYLYPPYPVVPATLPPNPLVITHVSGGSYWMTYNDDIIMCYNMPVTIYVPPSNGAKIKPIVIKNYQTVGDITLIPMQSGDLIDWQPSYIMTKGMMSITLIPWAGAYWWII